MSDDRNRYILYCKNFWVAADYAAEQDWWLHSWEHKVDDNATDEVIVIDKLKDDNSGI